MLDSDEERFGLVWLLKFWVSKRTEVWFFFFKGFDCGY